MVTRISFIDLSLMSAEEHDSQEETYSFEHFQACCMSLQALGTFQAEHAQVPFKI